MEDVESLLMMNLVIFASLELKNELSERFFNPIYQIHRKYIK